MGGTVTTGIVISLLSLAAGGTGAYTIVKSDIAVQQEKSEQLEKKFDHIDEKLDKIIDRLIEQNDRSDGDDARQ